MPFEPKDPPCRCPEEKQQTFRRGTPEDEEFYLEGVREMFAQNNEEWNTEAADRLFYRRVCGAGGVLIAGPGKRGYVLSEVRRNTRTAVLIILFRPDRPLRLCRAGRRGAIALSLSATCSCDASGAGGVWRAA
jgi:hypothetical protein